MRSLLGCLAVTWAVAGCSKSSSTGSSGSAAPDRSEARLDSEVYIMCAELDLREEQYHAEMGGFSADVAAIRFDAKWKPAACKLAVTPVAAGAAMSVPGFTVTPPAGTSFFYAVAECDGVTYLHTSFDAAVWRKRADGSVERLADPKPVPVTR